MNSQWCQAWHPKLWSCPLEVPAASVPQPNIMGVVVGGVLRPITGFPVEETRHWALERLAQGRTQNAPVSGTRAGCLFL